MGPFGDKLRRERERRGITLDEISAATKINTRMLRALEEEQFDLLPGGIFNKGFVRAYARQVGLDEEETVSGYVDASGEQPEQKLKPVEQARIQETRADAEHKIFRAIASIPWRSIPWQKLAAILGLLVFAFLIWKLHSRRTLRDEQESASSISAPAQTAGPSEEPAEKIERASEREKERASEKEKEPASALRHLDSPSQLAVPALAPGMFSLQIRAQDTCWIEVIADGKKVVEEILNASDQRSVAAKNQIIMKVGNAGALDVWFNGRKLAPLGPDEAVKTVAFNPNGLVPGAAKLPDAFSTPPPKP